MQSSNNRTHEPLTQQVTPTAGIQTIGAALDVDLADDEDTEDRDDDIDVDDADDEVLVDVASVLDVTVTKDMLDVVLLPIKVSVTLMVGQMTWFRKFVEQDVTVVVVDMVVTVTT